MRARTASAHAALARGTPGALRRRMKSLVASAFVLAALASAAHAGSYLGLGIGGQASTDGGLVNYDTTGKHSARLVAGYRFGQVSLEAGLGDYGLTRVQSDWNAWSLGAAAKLHLPLFAGFEAYVRAGLERTYLTQAGGDGTHDLTGDGWTGGLGVEYGID